MPSKKHRRRLILESLSRRELLAADAGVSIEELTTSPLVGGVVDATIRFENTGDGIGFGPYVDVIIPRGGEEAGGLTLVGNSVRALDTGVHRSIRTFNSKGVLTHPFARDEYNRPIKLEGTPGDQLAVFTLPIGSFTADQPAVEVTAQFNVAEDAEVGQTLELVVGGGFRYGGDAVNNPKDDPTIIGGTVSAAVTPSVFAATLRYDGAEDEIATGAAHGESYTIRYDVAEGVSIDEAQLRLRLGSELAIDSVQYPDGVDGRFTKSDDGYTLDLGRVTGVDDVDGTVVVHFHAPTRSAEGLPTIDLESGSNGVSETFVVASGRQIITADTDEAVGVSRPVASVTPTHELSRGIAVVRHTSRLVKDLKNEGLGENDHLDHHVAFDFGDDTRFQNPVLRITVPDGQQLISNGTLRLRTDDGESKGFNIGKSSAAASRKDTGTTVWTIPFDKAVEKFVDGDWDRLLGGTFDYTTKMKARFVDPVKSGDDSIDEGDRFEHHVALIVDTSDDRGKASGNQATNASSSQQTIARGEVRVAVHAINGDTEARKWKVGSGDVVTYRVRREVRGGDVEDLMIRGFLPQPVFELEGFVGGVPGELPLAGQIVVGPDDTFHHSLSSAPDLSVDPATDSFTLRYPDADTDRHDTLTVDLLYSVQVVDAPFADRLPLTHLVQSTSGSSNHVAGSSVDTARLIYSRPNVAIKKDAIASDNPDAARVRNRVGDGDLKNVDAGDTVTFEIRLTNTGSGVGGAHGVTFRDDQNQGFVVPEGGLNLKVTDLDGNPVAYTDLSQSDRSGVFDGGLRLTDPLMPGAEHTVVVTYDLVADGKRAAGHRSTMSAHVLEYSAVPGGVNFVTGSVKNNASVYMAKASAEQSLVSTSLEETGVGELKFGETATLQTRVRVPEGHMLRSNVTLKAYDGLKPDSIVSIVADDGIELAKSPEELIAGTRLHAKNGFDQWVIPFGTIVNADRDNGGDEYVTITYRVTGDDSASDGWLHSRVESTLSYYGGRSHGETYETLVRGEPRSIAGTVYLDADASGTETVGDRGLVDRAVTVVGTDWSGRAVRQEGLTDATGGFRFDGFAPGTYVVHHERWSQQVVINNASSASIDDVDFRHGTESWIEGTVFFDKDMDGELDLDEPGIEGIVVSVVGTTTAGEAVERSVTTNDRGYYVFGELPAGTYDIVEGETPDHFDSVEQLGDAGGTIGDDRFDGVVITPGSPAKGYNFSEYQPASISGNVYVDYDRDDAFDRRDGVLIGRELRLSGTDDLGNSVSQTVTTEADGSYRFEGLRPGTFRIETDAIDGLEFGVANVGAYKGLFETTANNGIADGIGFDQVVVQSGATLINYDVGYVDPTYEASLLTDRYDRQIVVTGTDRNDYWTVRAGRGEMTLKKGLNDITTIPADGSVSLRLVGLEGDDRFFFYGNRDRQDAEIKADRTRVEGTWYEIIATDFEDIFFDGGDGEDIARLYDTPGDDQVFLAQFQGRLSNDTHWHSVKRTHRIYAYATEGHDTLQIRGGGRDDTLWVNPEVAKSYTHDYYLFGSGFDEVKSSANHSTSRALLFAGDGDDHLEAGHYNSELTGVRADGSPYHIDVRGYRYVNVRATQAGTDTANFTGTDYDDYFRYRPLESTMDLKAFPTLEGNDEKKRTLAKAFEVITVDLKDGERDLTKIFDSHGDDDLVVRPNEYTIENGLSRATVVNFDRAYAYAEAGGDDTLTVHGGEDRDTLKAWPEQIKMDGSGSYLLAAGFTSVTAHGDAEDRAYLYGSVNDDLLRLANGFASISGQRFDNAINGFGKIVAENAAGSNRVAFEAAEAGSTVRVDGDGATIFGDGFSYDATGYDAVDAYYASTDDEQKFEDHGGWIRDVAELSFQETGFVAKQSFRRVQD